MRSRSRTDRFDGWIAGVGTTCGLRAVVGRWLRSPLGPFADVMVERADGHRILLAPTAEVAAYVSATYRFDEVRIVPVAVSQDDGRWEVAAGPLGGPRVEARSPTGLLFLGGDDLAHARARCQAVRALLRAEPTP